MHRLSFIELKSGRVDEMLLDKLEGYEPKEESLKVVEKDPLIEERYRNQARRVLRQKIRIAQIDQTLRTMKGLASFSSAPEDCLGQSRLKRATIEC